MVAFQAMLKRFHMNLRPLRASRYGGRSKEPLRAKLHAKLKLNLISNMKKREK